jgi:hypothetical protein
MTMLTEIALVVLALLGVTAALMLLPDVDRIGRPVSRPSVTRQPAQLVRLEWLVAGVSASTLQVHAYLRPLLTEIASHKLALRGDTLERLEPAIARDLLGDQLWDIVRPNRPFPEDREGKGVTTRELAAILDRLEHL